jgi:hypothetical protein
MNPSGLFMYSMSPTNEQNMSSNGGYQLVRFPREIGVCECDTNNAQLHIHTHTYTPHPLLVTISVGNDLIN